jgi:hypothetical protein
MPRTNADPPSEQKGMCIWKEDIFKIDNINTIVLYNEFEQKKPARLELSLK